MKILHVTPSFYPATFWGGPIWSTKAICDGIAAEPDVTLRVLTTDAAGPRVADRVRIVPLPYPVTYTRRIAGASVAPGLLTRLPAAIYWADLVHLTGTYNFPTLPVLALARMMGKPVVWSPRGALQATEVWDAAPRRKVKVGFERMAAALRPGPCVLHATSAAEAEDSIKRLPGLATALIANAVPLPPPFTRKRPAPGRCRLLFLGRVHPKKGVMALLDAMAQLPAGFTLDLCGTGEAAHMDAVARRAATLGLRVRLHGHVDGAAKTRAFTEADLFVLPSHSENFGIAVAEALAHGLPVLTTTATPWGALGVKGAGRAMDLAHDDLASEIRALALQDLPAMGARGRAWVAADFSPTAMVAEFMALYRDCIAGQVGNDRVFA